MFSLYRDSLFYHDNVAVKGGKMFHKDTHFERINFLNRESVAPITVSYPGNPCPSTEGFTNLLADTVSTLTTSTMLEVLISFKDFYIHARCMPH